MTHTHKSMLKSSMTISVFYRKADVRHMRVFRKLFQFEMVSTKHRKSISQNRRDGKRSADCSAPQTRSSSYLAVSCCHRGYSDGSMKTMITETRRLSPVITDSTTGWLASVKRRGKAGLALLVHSCLSSFVHGEVARSVPPTACLLARLSFVPSLPLASLSCPVSLTTRNERSCFLSARRATLPRRP